MSALALRILACVTMLLDHIGFCFPRLHFLRYAGRLAFPIFVFLIVNGYTHTSSRPRYALRLLLMAVISQIPFALFCHYEGVFESFNVFFTLLCALLAVWGTDALIKGRFTRWFAFLPGLLMAGLFYFDILSSDYGNKAILMALSFRYLSKKKFLLIPACFVSVFFVPLMGYALQLLMLLRGQEVQLVPPARWTVLQVLSLAALIPVFLYNGKKGASPKNPIAAKILQWSFYLFYPLHLILLYLVS